MKIKNGDIILFAEKLHSNFSNKTKYIPMKVAFAIQKNMNTLVQLTQEIEESKMEIAKEYGVLQRDGSYKIPQDKIAEANKELNDLATFEQEVNIKTVLYSTIENLEFTMPQVEAIMFMIEDDSDY